MALTPVGQRWLQLNGLGPGLFAIDAAGGLGGAAAFLQAAHPELSPEDADIVIGLALRARDAGSGRVGASTPPVDPSSPLGPLGMARTRTFRYRIRLDLIDHNTGRTIYRELVIDSASPLRSDQLDDTINDRVLDWIDDGTSDVGEQMSWSYTIRSVTRV